MTNKLKPLVVNNLTAIIIGGQIIVYLAISAGYINYSHLSINYNLILSGQFWRIITFLFIPPASSPIWSIFSWYILFLMGSNLEHYWGALHFNLYILIAVLFSNIAAFAFNLSVTTNYYLQSSIFLAFAFLNPNFQLRLFFIIPVKIKWIALVTWVLYLWAFIFGGLGAKILLIASLFNFLIFFYKDIFYKIKYRGKVVKTKIEKEVKKNIPLHVCELCGKNDIDHPYLDFRYCSLCNPEKCYCEEHIKNHNHGV